MQNGGAYVLLTGGSAPLQPAVRFEWGATSKLIGEEPLRLEDSFV